MTDKEKITARFEKEGIPFKRGSFLRAYEAIRIENGKTRIDLVFSPSGGLMDVFVNERNGGLWNWHFDNEKLWNRLSYGGCDIGDYKRVFDGCIDLKTFKEAMNERN